GWTDREGPAVAQIASGVSRLPGPAAIVAPRRAVARRLIGAASGARVPRDGVDVALRARAMVGEGRAAVLAVHEPAELDADEQALGAMRVRRDPAHVVGPGSRREAPLLPRGDLLKRLELMPALPAPGDEKPAGLGARVERAVGRAERNRVDVRLRQLDPLPRAAAVRAQEHVAPARADEHARSRGDHALDAGVAQDARDIPGAVRPPEPDQLTVTGAEEADHPLTSHLRIRPRSVAGRSSVRTGARHLHPSSRQTIQRICESWLSRTRR